MNSAPAEHARRARRAGTDLVVLGAARGISAFAGLVAVVLLARRLGPHDLGLWSIVLALQAWAALAAEFGLRSLATAECGRDPGCARGMLGRYIALRLAFALPVAVAGYLVGALLWPETRSALPWALSTLLASVAMFDWVALACGRSLEAAGLLVVRPAAWLAGIFLLPAHGGLADVAAVFAAAWFTAALVSLPSLRHLRRTDRRAAPSPRRILTRALPLGAAALAAQGQLALDLLVVGTVLGASAAASYYLASAALTAGLLFANAGGQVALARLGRHRDRAALFTSAVRHGLLALTALGTLLAAMAAVVAPVLLPPLFGADFADAVRLLPWLLPWFVLQHATTWLQGTLAAGGRESPVLIANLGALATLVAGLTLAAAAADAAAFALARATAELVKFALLWRAVAAAGRPCEPGAQPSRAAASATSF